jgi:hypothetical protein
MISQIPILLLVYNRPKHTLALINKLREIKPKSIYINLDGPKENKQDFINCQKVKKIISRIDWKCKLKFNYGIGNQGCRKSVSKGINWFFEKEKRGIILEDDCIPNLDFFNFCGSLLKKHKNENKILAISGSNFQKMKIGKYYYYFSKYPHCWGWATWRRAWRLYDANLTFWPKWKKSLHWKLLHKTSHEKRYWENKFEKVYQNKIDSWAYVWTASVWKNKGITAIPNVNLIDNIGFDESATHTFEFKKFQINNSKYQNFNDKSKILHPKSININNKADNYVFNNHFNGIYNFWPWRFFYLIRLFSKSPLTFIYSFYIKIKIFFTLK